MPETTLLQDMATVMIVATVMLFVSRRLRLPAVIGYLTAGVVIGPFTPPFSLVRDVSAIRALSELGLAFLMFGLGLEFTLPRFRRAGPAAAVSALLVVTAMLASGYLLGRCFGWSRADSVFLGCLLSISGSSAIAKLFMDLGLTHERFAGAVFGLMICEDVAAMVMLSVVSGLGAAGVLGLGEAALPLLKIIFFVTLFLLSGLLLVPRLFNAVSRLHNPEVAGLLTIGLCLGAARLAAAFGFSVALGAFLMGAVVASTHQAAAVGEWMKPVRSMFTALFFVSAGMLVDPAVAWERKGAVAAVAAAAILLRCLFGTAASVATGHTLEDSVKIGAGVAQIGEFSFVIAGLGAGLGLASSFLYPTAVFAAFASMLAAPYLLKHAGNAARGLAALFPGLAASRRAAHEAPARSSAGRGAIFGRYLVRLAAYAAVLLGLALALDRVSPFLAFVGRGWLWAGRAAFCAAVVPLALLAAKYVSHFFLLLVAQLLSFPSLGWLFKRVSIRVVYDAFHFATLAALAGVVIDIVAPDASSVNAIVLAAFAVAGVLEATKRRLTPVAEWIEERLDEALGRATSEPTRYAILMIGDKRSLFYDLTEQLLLPEGAAAVGRTIESLRLRASTGATIAAIYRGGEHLTNPPPETVLAANDLVVLLGEPLKRETARSLLLEGR